jgi:hypothetical protein
MADSTIHHLGVIRIKSLRDYILDNSLGEDDTITLNQRDFDALALEYRRTYNEGIDVPFNLLRVLIKEDESLRVHVGKIKVIKNDEERDYEDYLNIEEDLDAQYKYDNIYRCGYCGNVVDFDGKEFSDDTRRFKIGILEKFEKTVKQTSVHGACCRDRQ